MINIFIAYAREDVRHLKTFLTYVADIERDDVEFFNDQDIHPGHNWETTLLSRLNSAEIVVFLITPNFIGSKFCMDRELPVALNRHSAGNCKILPLKVAPFVVRDSSPLRKFQWTPSGKPITSRQGPALRHAWVEAAEAVRREVEALRVK
ncbi:toll/interleukin-1 receptor domain-containing protein [Amycolatopsis sp. NPDC004169]|uniref:toll/interleukin-1 receptor domain-containing protein n=1 Tax=Amycolatopsis sp. NPDC004169 TaxID=3154453 RepID=UPI00339DFE0D